MAASPRLLATAAVVTAAAFAGGLALGAGGGEAPAVKAAPAGKPLETVAAGNASLDGARLGKAAALPALRRERRASASGSSTAVSPGAATSVAGGGSSAGSQSSGSAGTTSPGTSAPPSSGNSSGSTGSADSGSTGPADTGAGTGGPSSQPDDPIVVSED